MCTITASIKCVQMFSAVLQEEFRYMHYMCCTFLCCDFNSLIASFYFDSCTIDSKTGERKQRVAVEDK